MFQPDERELPSPSGAPRRDLTCLLWHFTSHTPDSFPPISLTPEFPLTADEEASEEPDLGCPGELMVVTEGVRAPRTRRVRRRHSWVIDSLRQLRLLSCGHSSQEVTAELASRE